MDAKYTSKHRTRVTCTGPIDPAGQFTCIYLELLAGKPCHNGLGCILPFVLIRITPHLCEWLLKMTRLNIKTSCIAALVAAPALAFAAPDTASTISSYGSLGTQGIGAGVSIPLTERSAMRLELNGLSISNDFSEDGISYEGKLKNTSVSALYDWHFSPASSFRATVGLVFNDGGIHARGTSTAAGTYTVGGTTVAAGSGEYVDADAEFRKISPYIGIGWSKVANERGFSFFGDIGAFYAKPQTRLTLSPVLGAAVNAADPNAVERENEKIQDRFDSLKWYPVLRIGARYTF